MLHVTVLEASTCSWNYPCPIIMSWAFTLKWLLIQTPAISLWVTQMTVCHGRQSLKLKPEIKRIRNPESDETLFFLKINRNQI